MSGLDTQVTARTIGCAWICRATSSSGGQTDFGSALSAIERAVTVSELSAAIIDQRDTAGLAHLVYHTTDVPACDKANPLLAAAAPAHEKLLLR